MACCLAALSHYLNQCWLFITWVQWHIPQEMSQSTNHWNPFEDNISKILSKFPRGEWVKDVVWIEKKHTGFYHGFVCRLVTSMLINSLWLSDSIWLHEGWSTLFQVKGCFSSLHLLYDAILCCSEILRNLCRVYYTFPKACHLMNNIITEINVWRHLFALGMDN